MGFLRGRQILVVDDNRDCRELLTFFLVLEEAEAIETASAFEALTVLHICKPHLLISDLKMPIIDGYGFIEQVRSLDCKQNRHIPAIAVSGLARQEDCDRALSAGFHQFLSKPIDLDKLTASIISLL